MARVLLTGASGFLGRAVLAALVDEGDVVTALVRSDRAAQMARARGAVNVVRADLDDPSSLASLSNLARDCEVVVHLAALVDPAMQTDEARIDRVVRAASIALGRAARSFGARRFVFVSSIAAMGIRSVHATADTPCSPTTPYGRAKLAAERALAALDGLEVTTLRPPTIYGPGERYNFLSLVRAIERGLFRIVGRGDNVFPLCTDLNAARAIVAAAHGRVGAGVVLVADAERYPMWRVHEAIARALGRRPPRVHLPVALARLAGGLNEVASAVVPFVPRLLTRARVDTLVADQPFDVGPLLRAGVALDAPLETHARATVDEHRSSGALDGA